MQVKPYDSTLEKLFRSAYFKIPRFQRPYSWDKGNIEEFWNDIVAAGKQSHFVGSMVFYFEDNDQELYVVDGQQRLTTATIFLAALRDVLTECGEAELAEGLQGLIERADKRAKKRFVLLTESSFPYFQEYIQKMGAPEVEKKPSDEERGIKSAYDFARAGFLSIVGEARQSSPKSDKQKKEIRNRLERCRDALLSLDIIVVQLNNENDAHIVFETLNTRGRDLETKDLVKNLLTKFLPPESADVDPTKMRWDALVKSISGSSANLDTSSFIHHAWLSRYDYTPARTLYSKIKAHLNKGNAAAFLASLEGDIEPYRRIFEPDEFDWDKEARPIRKSLEALATFKMRQPTPFVLSVLRAYFAKILSLKQARDALGAVEKFHFAYTAIAGQSSSGGVSMMYAAAGREISTQQDAQKRATHLQEFRKKLLSRLPDEASFVAGFVDLRYSQLETRQRPLVRYVLEEIDASLRKGDPIDYSRMTVEHIAPQNPQGGRALSRHGAIGNLLFVSEDLNGKLKNKEFAEKKKLLKGANVPLDDVLSNADQWSSKEIDARTKHLAQLIYERLS